MNWLKILAIYAISIIICALIAKWFFENYLYQLPVDISSEGIRNKIIEGEIAVGGTIAMFVGGILGIVVALLGRMLLSLQHNKS